MKRSDPLIVYSNSGEQLKNWKILDQIKDIIKEFKIKCKHFNNLTPGTF